MALPFVERMDPAIKHRLVASADAISPKHPRAEHNQHPLRRWCEARQRVICIHSRYQLEGKLPIGIAIANKIRESPRKIADYLEFESELTLRSPAEVAETGLAALSGLDTPSIGALEQNIFYVNQMMQFGKLLAIFQRHPTREGDSHEDRDAQFAHINAQVGTALAEGQPVISVDTKKKELVGDFKNGGREWRARGDPEEVRVHDFLIKELGRAVPYGIYDLASNTGWVSVGINHDTAAFAVQTIRRWWQKVGRLRYPGATRLVITADGGGSNGSRVRLWKRELQRLADETGLAVEVHHLPPGTSKWNKIEHRLFSFITQNWRARPLVSYKVIRQARSTQSDLCYPRICGVGHDTLGSMAGSNAARCGLSGAWFSCAFPTTGDPACDPPASRRYPLPRAMLHAQNLAFPAMEQNVAGQSGGNIVGYM